MALKMLLLYLYFVHSANSAELSSDQVVTCYRNSADCSNGSGETMLTADQCCNSAYSSTAHISHLNQCHRCLKIGFNATSLYYNTSNIGDKEQLVVSVQYETQAGDKNLDNEAQIIIGPDRVLNANDYLRKGTGQVQKRIADELPYTIEIEVASGNNIGLNPALEFNYTIKLHDDGFIPGEPIVLVFGRTFVRVEDLDVVEVSFDKSKYTYSENQGTVNNMNLKLNTSIAQSLTVGMKGGPGSQPLSVVKSGIIINIYVAFTAGGSLTTSVPQFNIQDDTTALETSEHYNYTLTSSSITKNVVLGRSAVFEILDDDVAGVSFDKSKYYYQEDAGSVSGVIVNLNTTIARNLDIDVTGDPGSQLSTVDVSGTSITDTVTFQAYSNVLSQTVSDATIKNDTTALETVETYTYKLTNPSITDGVALGADTQIEIIDDDVAKLSFESSSYKYIENHGDVTDINVVLDKKVVQNFTVTVSGGPGNQLSTVAVSGVDYSTTVTFPANSSAGTTITLPSFRIRNDSFALETLETYNLSFTGSSASVVFGPPTQIEIEDDDKTETISPAGQLSVSSLVGSNIASIIATNIVTVVVISSVLLYCWKGRKEKKTSVPTDSNPVVIYDEAKVDERVIDSSVPKTDNPAYGTSLH